MNTDKAGQQMGGGSDAPRVNKHIEYAEVMGAINRAADKPADSNLTYTQLQTVTVAALAIAQQLGVKTSTAIIEIERQLKKAVSENPSFARALFAPETN